MAQSTDIVLILGSGPTATVAKEWPRDWFDRIVAINNAWRLRPDWDDLIFPEDFPDARKPGTCRPEQRFIEAGQFVDTQNACGGFIYAGGTMAFTAGYWALRALRPKTLAFLGCDMVYPKTGQTHFYGQGTADPLRADITLQDLGAKSARLAFFAASQGCCCVNLSTEPSELLFERVQPDGLRDRTPELPDVTRMTDLVRQEERLGYFVPNGRYWEADCSFDATALAALDAGWRKAWMGRASDARAA